MAEREGPKAAGAIDDQLRVVAELPAALLGWYAQNARPLPWRSDCDPYRVWISEIMLQQTRAEAVKAYYARFLEEVPTLPALAAIDEARLLKLWEGLGYYGRARNLKRAARMIAEELGGRFPETREGLLKLPGVGAYTAGAIASICFGQPTSAVDGNVLRIVARIAGIDEPVDTPKMKKRIASALEAIHPADQSGAFTQSLMELGATVCLPSGAPQCAICPAQRLCFAFKSNAVLHFPVKADKRGKKLQPITVLVLSFEGALAIRRREQTGLLAGLWEFPNAEGELDEARALELAAEWETAPVSITRSAFCTHTFTHIKWLMTCYDIDCAAAPGRFVWADRATLSGVYALPSAFRKLLN